MQPDEFYDHISDKRNREEVEQSRRREFRGLEIKYNRNINAETDLENRDLLGREHPEVYRRLKAKYQNERIWIEERQQAIAEELAQLDRQAEAAATLQEIQARVTGRLDQLSEAEWQELFIALNLEIHIRDSNDPTTWPNHWWENQATSNKKSIQIYIDGPSSLTGESQAEVTLPTPFRPPYGDEIEICFGLPMRIEQVGGIVFNRAWPALSSCHRTLCASGSRCSH